ncbi:MAG: hypothetical protein ACXWVD_00090 [Telluria sp.]
MNQNTEPAYYTIQMGAGTDVPLIEGGTGPDEPVWYFDLKEQFDLAVAQAAKMDVAITTGSAESVPDGDFVSDAAEFAEYVTMQAVASMEPQPNTRPVPHTVTQRYLMHCPACGLDNRLQVAVAEKWWDLTADGLACNDDGAWNERSPCRCRCGWEGTVKQAKIDESAAWPQGAPY